MQSIQIVKKYANISIMAGILFLSGAALLFLLTSVAFALPMPCKSGDANDNMVGSSCYESNFQEAKKHDPSLTAEQFNDIVSTCDGTDRVLGTGVVNPTKYITTTTSFSSCSNAFASCLQHQVDQEACKDHNVLALGTKCSTFSNPGSGGSADINGDIGSGGDCGWDQAIKDTNTIKGSDFKTNDEAYQERAETYKEKECSGLDTTTAIADCNKQIDDQAASCHSQLGGGDTTASVGQFDKCMTEASANADQCKARGGTWGVGAGQTGSDTGVCTPPSDEDKDGDGNPDGQGPATGPGGGGVGKPDGRCGNAHVNIIVCGGDEDTPASEVFGNVLKIALMVLTLLVGVAAVGGLAWASVTYARATDNSGTVSEAKDMIRNIVIGILLYGFLLAIVNWLVPGSVIGGGGGGAGGGLFG